MYNKVIKGRGLSVIYIDGKDRWVKTGGSRSWRNNNPGNLKSGPHTRINGSIGRVEGFAIFPSEEAGTKARVNLLKGSRYRSKTISEMVDAYAPREDGNNPERYKRQIKMSAGLDRDRKLSSLTEKEFQALIGAMKRIEGFTPGTEEKFRAKEIVDIKTNEKNAIIAYRVEGLGWFSKPEVIRLTEEGRIDAVVVTRQGSTFIRTRPDYEVVNNLEEKKPRRKSRGRQ